jgi:arylsulfatase A-like enzyme
VHYTDPHSDYEPPEPYDRAFVGDTHYAERPLPSPLPPTLRGTKPGTGRFRGEEARNLDWHVAQYDGEIRHTDEEIGRLLRRFRDRGALSSTLVVFTADHGESFGEQGYFGHGETAHDSNAQVPLVWWWPGRIPAGRRIPAVVETVDILPTTLELLGAAAPPAAQGRSFARELRDPTSSFEQGRALVEAGFGRHFPRGVQQAVRTADWLYVWRDVEWIRRVESPLTLLWIWNASFEGGLDPDELYDLKADPTQERDVLRLRPETAQRLRAGLFERFERLGPPRATARTVAREALRRLEPEVEAELEALGYLD